MRNLAEKIFPLLIYLHIFQLEGYQSRRLIMWIFRNFFVRELENKKPLVWTPKARRIFAISIAFTLLLPILVFIFSRNLPLSFYSLALVILQPYIQLTLAIALLKPYEMINKNRVLKETMRKIAESKKLTVIGITGSFGKTAVKDILYQMLKTRYDVLRTPSSYNTLFGIAKVIDLELDQNYDFFICEMGAFKKGEISELVKMVRPTYGILTGIAPQHLERFGSIDNIIQAKFELPKSLPRDGFAVLNGDSNFILQNTNHLRVPFLFYGIDNPKAQVEAKKVQLSENGATFTLRVGRKTYNVKTGLLGGGGVSNILAAASMAIHLGIPPDSVIKIAQSIFPTPNRLEPIKKGGLLIINDSYSSNIEGFKDAVEVAGSIKRAHKILVTPGIVELGNKTEEIHKELGKLCSRVFNVVLLVGKNERTRALEKGLRLGVGKPKITFISRVGEAHQYLEKLDAKNSVVLFENDLPDNY